MLDKGWYVNDHTRNRCPYSGPCNQTTLLFLRKRSLSLRLKRQPLISSGGVPRYLFCFIAGLRLYVQYSFETVGSLWGHQHFLVASGSEVYCATIKRDERKTLGNCGLTVKLHPSCRHSSPCTERLWNSRMPVTGTDVLVPFVAPGYTKVTHLRCNHGLTARKPSC